MAALPPKAKSQKPLALNDPSLKTIQIEKRNNTMNLATWFKGLGVFALSSVITALATMQLDPASFNFSKAGLTKVGAAALVIGVKSVLLYMKQSPLPGNQPARITRLDEDHQRTGALRGHPRVRAASGMREYVGPDNVCFTGREQSADRLRRSGL
jgi:hypothetical protein